MYLNVVLLGVVLILAICISGGWAWRRSKPRSRDLATARMETASMGDMKAENFLRPHGIGTAPSTALAVEGIEHDRTVLANTLEQLGFVVELAHDGESALGLLRQKAYDLILTNLTLPDGDGIELVKQMDPLLSQPKPPVIALGSSCSDADKQRMEESGILYHSLKPVTPESLKRAILKATGVEAVQT